jgi:sulfite reductase alpha subunit-like flavoprotein
MRMVNFFRDNYSTFMIFVAGNSKEMPKSVEKGLRKLFIELKDGNEGQGNEIYDQLASSGRICFETWS